MLPARLRMKATLSSAYLKVNAMTLRSIRGKKSIFLVQEEVDTCGVRSLNVLFLAIKSTTKNNWRTKHSKKFLFIFFF